MSGAARPPSPGALFPREPYAPCRRGLVRHAGDRRPVARHACRWTSPPWTCRRRPATPDLDAAALAIAYAESDEERQSIARTYLIALARAYGVPVAFTDGDSLAESITVPHCDCDGECTGSDVMHGLSTAEGVRREPELVADDTGPERD